MRLKYVLINKTGKTSWYLYVNPQYFDFIIIALLDTSRIIIDPKETQSCNEININ